MALLKWLRDRLQAALVAVVFMETALFVRNFTDFAQDLSSFVGSLDSEASSYSSNSSGVIHVLPVENFIKALRKVVLILFEITVDWFELDFIDSLRPKHSKVLSVLDLALLQVFLQLVFKRLKQDQDEREAGT